MDTYKPKHILVAPLDWGLGHTARCVPVIGYLQRQGHRVTVAGNEKQRLFIEETFGAIDFIHLEGYNITYSQLNKWMQAGLLAQIPRILQTIKAEHLWLVQVCRELKIDGIISDNRYGLYHDYIPSAIITHQLRVRTGLGAWADALVRRLHYRMLNKFQSTWVADVPGVNSLAPYLSQPSALPKNSQYIGLLSRFECSDHPKKNNKESLKNADIVMLISGAEPQRTELSAMLWQQAQQHNGKVIFVEGDKDARISNIPGHITYYPLLTGAKLLPVLQTAGIVVCRSGYSTIMDLLALQKRAILIPTPGQTEQEYLAKRLTAEGYFHSCDQKKFSLHRELAAAETFPYRQSTPTDPFTLYQQVLRAWADAL